MLKQRTLKKKIGTTGVGLHTGTKVTLTLRPAAVDTGIVSLVEVKEGDTNRRVGEFAGFLAQSGCSRPSGCPGMTASTSSMHPPISCCRSSVDTNGRSHARTSVHCAAELERAASRALHAPFPGFRSKTIPPTISVRREPNCPADAAANLTDAACKAMLATRAARPPSVSPSNKKNALSDPNRVDCPPIRMKASMSIYSGDGAALRTFLSKVPDRRSVGSIVITIDFEPGVKL